LFFLELVRVHCSCEVNAGESAKMSFEDAASYSVVITRFRDAHAGDPVFQRRK
jgi:hypothetical protein